jgi:hypothetical protein
MDGRRPDQGNALSKNQLFIQLERPEPNTQKGKQYRILNLGNVPT